MFCFVNLVTLLSSQILTSLISAKRQLRKVHEIRKLIDALDPTYVLPFASYIYFCHEENFYMNDNIADVKTVADEISSAGSIPLVLYPGDIFDFKNKHLEATAATVTNAAIGRYQSDISNIKIKHFTSDKTYSTQELKTASKFIWTEFVKLMAG